MILTASSLAYFGESLIGRLRGVLGGEGVEGSHVEDISCVLGGELGMRVGGGVRGVVGPVWVGEITHWTGRCKRTKKEKEG
jgi:hypothetical protein